MPVENVPLVLLRLRDQLYGVPAIHVREMVEMPPVSDVSDQGGPGLSDRDDQLGSMTLRDERVPVVDLRRILGLPTSAEELLALSLKLVQAEEEHRALAGYLERVRECHGQTPGNGPCCFGTWFHALQPENAVLRVLIEELAGPHQELHDQADRVLRLVESNPLGAATALRRFQEKELPVFVESLVRVRDGLAAAARQVLAVLTQNGSVLAMAVDEVESIERLVDGSLQEFPAHLRRPGTEVVRWVGRRARDGQLVLRLEVDQLFDQVRSAPPIPPSDQVDSASRGRPKTESSAEPAEEKACAERSRTKDRVSARPRSVAWCGDPKGPWVEQEAVSHPEARFSAATKAGPMTSAT